jgi:raffinose/stachyose/melibiose transport system substrate-binding protein
MNAELNQNVQLLLAGRQTAEQMVINFDNNYQRYMKTLKH